MSNVWEADELAPPPWLREWESQGTSPRARALQALAIYVRLTEWYDDDMGVLELK